MQSTSQNILIMGTLLINLAFGAASSQSYKPYISATPPAPALATLQYQEKPININGDWKCIKRDYRGLGKFNAIQANDIRRSILHIQAHTYFFSRASFINKCVFYEWKAEPFQNADDAGRKLRLMYDNTQLKQIVFINSADSNGQSVCYNECTFFKLRDTLITNCGGYVFFWKKTRLTH